MEEDIKKCEALLGSERWVLGTQDKKALENLIKGYRELKKENKRLKKYRPIRFVPSVNDNKSWYSPYKKY